MNKETLPIVPYERDRHEAAYLRFLEKVLGAQKCARRRRVLDSIHEVMPARERLPVRYLILDGDRVAGSMGHLPADFLVDGKTTPVRFTHDLLVDPDYRGRGLAKQIVEHASGQGDFFVGGMWMTDPCFKIHLACGFDDAAPLTTHTLVLDSAAFVRRRGMSWLKGRVSQTALALARARALKAARATLKRSDLEVQSVPEFDLSLDSDWARMAASYNITRVRDAAYLNWKYAHHPNIDYRMLLARRGSSPAGYVVWRTAPEDAQEKRAVIADFLADKGDADVLRPLLARIILESFDSGMEYLSILTTQTWAAGLLRASGFFPRGEQNTWAIAGWRNNIPESWLSEHDRWHICLGDSDGDIWTGGQ